MQFCKDLSIPSSGGKEEVFDRIIHFLKSGKVIIPKTAKRTGPWDSEKGLTKETPVINFKNDQATRDFFVSEVGDRFRVNQYLRDFCKQMSDGSMSYGELIEGYKNSLLSKKKTIDKQFQYNQFQRDFFKHEIDKTREDCAKAWKLIRSLPGNASYEHYKEVIS